MEHAIAIRGLCKQYGDFRLEDVSFNVPGGSIVGLIGENGAGKSTTLKCILNLVRRDRGEIRLLGRDAIADERQVKQEIGVVLDETSFHDSLRPMDVERILRRIYRCWDPARFAACLQKFHLPRDRYIRDFSRGMKMKLAIAAALAHQPRLLILDEATSGLDPVVRDEILDEFLDFIQDETHAILLSSHITSDLEKAADYIVYLHAGRVALQGEKDVLLDTYGRLACSRAQLAAVDPAFLVGSRVGQFGCEALIRNRRDFRRRYPELTVDPVTLEEIMVLTGKGDARK